MCERLHGHNYRVAVTVDGPVDPATGFVVDFAVLKRVVQAAIEPLDHRVLVPDTNPSLRVHEADGQVIVDYTRPGWLVVPAAHACLIPVAQTTAERVAEKAEKTARAEQAGRDARLAPDGAADAAPHGEGRQ